MKLLGHLEADHQVAERHRRRGRPEQTWPDTLRKAIGEGVMNASFTRPVYRAKCGKVDGSNFDDNSGAGGWFCRHGHDVPAQDPTVHRRGARSWNR